MADDTLVLLSRSAVDQLIHAGPEFREFLDRFLVPGGPVRRFPNGAVEIDNGRVGDDEQAEAFRSCASPGHEIEGAYVFKTLGPFQPKRYYGVQYPIAYQERLRSEDSFEVGQGRISNPAPGEYDLARLEVTVGFRTRVGKATRLAFVAAVSGWAAAARERGAFDDGPVSLASQGVEFNGARARFRIDARSSGQDTLNWLALAMLDFGEDVHAVTGVYFGATAEFLDASTHPPRGEWALVEFAGNGPAAAPAGYVPDAAKPCPEFESQTFPVLVLPIDEWDSFVATVYFGRSLSGAEREQFAALIDAWSLLGSCGGFGGRGTHSANAIRFDEATDSAILRADMGDSNPEIALPVLIKSLDGFVSGGPPIDALVFGRPQ